MKYVIWGSGIRGRKVLGLLGRNQVVAFVDADITKVGQRCEDILIYDLETAIRLFQDCIYIITPMGYEAEIAQILESKGVSKYIEMGYPYTDISKDDFFKGYLWDIPKDKCALYGIVLFNLLLYEHLKKETVETIYLIPENGAKRELVDALAEEYDIGLLEELLHEIKIITLTEEIQCTLPDTCNMEYICSILKRGMPIFNVELLKFKNIHKGKRCFIVATGPSLKLEDLEMLKKYNEITFSMNRIYNLFDKTSWRPNYYVIQDYKAIEDLADEIANLDIQYKFVAHRPESYWQIPAVEEKSIKFKIILEGYKEHMPSFADDITKGIYEGYTVTYACLQIAVYMGFEEIYLVGVDFDYKPDIYSDQNHFPGYQKSDRPVRLNDVYPDLVALAYKKAELYSTEQGIKIYNATRGGKLEIFERIEFDSLF